MLVAVSPGLIYHYSPNSSLNGYGSSERNPLCITVLAGAAAAAVKVGGTGGGVAVTAEAAAVNTAATGFGIIPPACLTAFATAAVTG